MKHYIENKDSIYPALKGCLSASTRLEDIFNYLNSSNNKKKLGQNILIMHNKKKKKNNNLEKGFDKVKEKVKKW